MAHLWRCGLRAATREPAITAIVFSRSQDEGITWASPLRLVGLARPGKAYMATWAFPLISKSGRIQVIYNQYQGIDDVIHPIRGPWIASTAMI